MSRLPFLTRMVMKLDVCCVRLTGGSFFMWLFARRAGLHKIIENAVRDRFIEGALVSVGGEIKLQRLAFDAERVWHVLDYDLGKVSLTRHRTE